MADAQHADLSRLHIVVPIRALADGKHRLSPVLDDQQREALVVGLLRRTLDVLMAWPGAAAVHVISPDPAVGPIAAAAGARPLRQSGDGLNEGIIAARAVAMADGASALLIIPGDLPLLEAAALEALVDAADAAVAAGSGHAVVVVAPADARTGTNALLLSPPGAIEPGFGPGSLERHLRAAEAIGASTQLVVDPTLGFDLDTPADLALLEPAALAALLALGSGAPA
ncbi:MAG: 2-phospho-L-lactate guanylyltransferase [Candidatus Limnocylindrales bacterium]